MTQKGIKHLFNFRSVLTTDKLKNISPQTADFLTVINLIVTGNKEPIFEAKQLDQKKKRMKREF